MDILTIPLSIISIEHPLINPLKTKRRLLSLKPSPYRAVNSFQLGYKNHSVYFVRDDVVLCS